MPTWRRPNSSRTNAHFSKSEATGQPPLGAWREMDRNARLQILCVSKRLPARDVTHAGGQITYYYLSSVARWADLDLIALVTRNESPGELPAVRTFDLVSSRLDAHDASSPRGLLTRAIAYSRLLLRAIRMTSKMRTRRYDLVILERSAVSWIAPLLRRFCRVQTVLLIVHDFWFDRLQADAARASGSGASYLRLLSRIARSI